MAKLFDPRQLHRLITHEDAVYYHAHKLFGILVLGHFCWRFGLYQIMGSMFMETDPSIPFWILVHAGLHISSFQFIISSRRNKTYNIIWPEMRWHSLIFAYRSILAMAVQWLANQNRIPWMAADVVRPLIAMGTFLAADYVTYYYKNIGQVEKQDSTMRGMPYPTWVSRYPSYIRVHNLFYSVSQVFATMIIMDTRCIAHHFVLLVAIQTAPFCMTLVKKGIIDQGAWHVYYTLALLAGYYYGITSSCLSARMDSCFVFPGHGFKLMVALFSIGRFRFHMNKYLLWGPIALAHVLYVLLPQFITV